MWREDLRRSKEDTGKLITKVSKMSMSSGGWGGAVVRGEVGSLCEVVMMDIGESLRDS